MLTVLYIAIAVLITYFVTTKISKSNNPSNVLTNNPSDVLERVLDRVLEYNAILVKQKDVIIESLTKENTELRESLDEAIEMTDTMYDSDDDDDSEVSMSEVNTGFKQIMESSTTSAHVALDLHEKILSVQKQIKTGREMKAAPSTILDIVSKQLE
ncbi:MAG: hypothetical protein ACRYGG_00385 [Janthinobacterium lividum]